MDLDFESKTGLYDKPYSGRNRFSVIITGFAYT